MSGDFVRGVRGITGVFSFLCLCSQVFYGFTTRSRWLYDVGDGGDELSTVGVVVSDGRMNDRRRLLRRLTGRKFQLARTALSHSLGRLGITGTTDVGKGCMCMLPGGAVCGHVARRRSTDRVLVRGKFVSVRFSTGLTMVGAHPKCTDDLTCSVSGQGFSRVLKAVTNSSAVVLIVHRNYAETKIGGTLSLVVPGVRWCGGEWGEE